MMSSKSLFFSRQMQMAPLNKEQKGILTFLGFLLIGTMIYNYSTAGKVEKYGNVDSKALGISYPDQILPSDLLPIDNVAAGVNGLPPTADVNRNYLYPSDGLNNGVALSGLNTLQNHRKIPNLSERQDVPIPKAVVSPWNNSSVEGTFQQKDIWSV